jgi:hypothetical protein
MVITKKHFISFVFLAIFSVIQILALFPFTNKALADDALFNNQQGMNDVGAVFGNQKTDLRVTAARMITIALGFLAIIFFALTLFAGFRYMTSAGNQEQTKKAIAQIRDSVIGLLIVLAAWALSSYLLRTLSRAVANKVNL